MDLRVRPLADVDPLAVPLPHGTEVVTRVDRVVPAPDGGTRIVPEGAIGRVVAGADDEYEVLVLGVGRARYRRAEIVPRRVGQARWAARRFSAWEALSRCAVLEATVGSRAWGLADERSDTDVRGVFVLPFAWTIGLGDPPLDLVSADGSAVYWESSKAVRQALRADPNTLEMLFVPSARALDPIGQWLLDARDAFVSVEIHGSFGRYALSQLKRLTQAHRLAESRELVLGWLRDDEACSLDAVVQRLAARLREAPTPDDLHQARAAVKQLYRSLHDQGCLESAEFAALSRFARSPAAATPELSDARTLRPKNAYNLLRLVALAVGWLRTGVPELEARGALRDRLLAIKRGEVALEDVVADAEAMTPDLEDARRTTRLPKRPDVAAADALLRRIGEEIARRAVHREPGPWGADAPEPPALAWEDP